MSMHRLVRVSALAMTVLALPVLAGCGGSNPFHPPIDNQHTLPGDVPQNDTPQNTMIRFQKAYQYQDITQYANLLTADFRYTFSVQSDPTLAQTYGNNWGKDDETESAKHLLTGFTNSSGTYVPPASNISISFINDQYYPDPLHSDSTSYYVYCPVSTVNLNIDVPSGDGTTTYNISAPHSFYLVRGDAALLDAGQSAASDRWYIRHWDDLSPALSSVIQIARANASIQGSSSFGGGTVVASWGNVKDAYFR
jgi:hypothetical protein